MTHLRHVAVARAWHEANSFTPVRTRLADFQRREWCSSDDARRVYAGTRTEIGGAIDFAAGEPRVRVHLLHCCAAPPGGIVDADASREIAARILAGLTTGPAGGGGRWDAVYLSLHGAMIAEDAPSFELALLERVREAIGAVPLAASFDLHANLPPAVARLADVACGYRTYPHVDMDATAHRALSLLARTLFDGVRPRVVTADVGAILPSHNMRTAGGPMREIEDEAARIEREARLLDVTPFGGFVYGDTPYAGARVAVTVDMRDAATDDPLERAQAAARSLAAFVRARRARFEVTLPSATEGIARVLTLLDDGEDVRLAAGPAGHDARPVALVEPSDNPLSGGVGDTTGLLRPLLAQAADVPAVFAFFWDHSLVARARAAGVGARLACTLGGRLAPAFGGPVAVDAVVERLTDGRFVNAGPMEAGLAVDLGPTAVLRVGALRVIVTSTCQSPNDAGYFALHGIDLAAVRILAVKAKNHFRAAFAERCRAIVDVDTPGPAAADWRALPWRHAPAELLR